MIQKPRYSARSVFQLRIYLRDIEPTIWRRVLVPGNMTLAKLHLVIQGAFGWLDYHLHEFEVYGKRYGMVMNEWDDDDEVIDDSDVRLHQFLKVHDHLSYLYDFGDYWMHDIEVEAAEDVTASLRKAVCLDGARARPPEDCGSLSGFANFLAIMADPTHEEHDDYVTWFDGEFDPEHFSLAETNVEIQRRH